MEYLFCIKDKSSVLPGSLSGKIKVTFKLFDQQTVTEGVFVFFLNTSEICAVVTIKMHSNYHAENLYQYPVLSSGRMEKERGLRTARYPKQNSGLAFSRPQETP